MTDPARPHVHAALLVLAFLPLLPASRAAENPRPPSFPLEELAARCGLRVELEYKKSSNITGKKLYPKNFRAYASPELAGKLNQTVAVLRKYGYGLTILDAWRPPVASAFLWNAAVAADARNFFAPPDISAHTRGAAVDVTLHRLAAPNERVEMPSDFDYVGPPVQSTSEANFHAALLRKAMGESGLTPNSREWWHFELPLFSTLPIVQNPWEKNGLVCEGGVVSKRNALTGKK